MFGRSCSYLLIFLCSLVPPPFLCGQSDHASSASDLSVALPRLLEIPDRDQIGTAPVSNLRRRSPITPDFPKLTTAAGTIFLGTVTAIARHPATAGQSVETVAITFHVERAILGATPGEELTISQWIGLWSAGQRYRVGERLLLCLYPPSKLGLTSSVAGPLGRFTVDSMGRVLLSAQHLSAFRADPVLGGKSQVRFSDFALAVRRTRGEE